MGTLLSMGARNSRYTDSSIQFSEKVKMLPINSPKKKTHPSYLVQTDVDEYVDFIFFWGGGEACSDA